MMNLEAWESGGSFVSHRGHLVFCREGGPRDGPALVLIHGFPTSSWDFEALWAPLTQRYRVLTLDMLGFGLSAKPRTGFGYSILEQADLIEDRLAALGITEFHLLAHDYGDTVAQELLARKLPGLKSVCFLNGGLFPETHHPLFVQKLLLSPIGNLVARLSSRRQFEASLRRIFGKATQPSPQFLEAHWKLLTRGEDPAVLAQLIRYMPERIERRERWVGALLTSKVPLKLIDGADDPVSGRHMAARYRELVPSADVTLLEGIGHYPQVEAPEAVLEAYLQFRTGKT